MALFLIAFLLLAGFAGGNTLYNQQETLALENQKLKNEIVHAKAHLRQQKEERADAQKSLLLMDGLKIKNMEQEAYDK